MFFPEDVPEGLTAREAADLVLPGSPDAAGLAAVMDWVLLPSEGRPALKEFLSELDGG